MINLVKAFWLPITLFILLAITTLSLWPVESLPKVAGSDKTHHFISYAALVFAVALKKPKHWLWITLALAGFSGIIELIQPYVNRYGEWLDLFANIIGLICGILLARVVELLNTSKIK